ncbi:MAG: multiprotein bridging factor aMBF1 [Candidatus Diapherotrites archaeon]
MLCEVCGKKTAKLYRAEIEGAELSVCEECSKLGKVLMDRRNDAAQPKIRKKITQKPDIKEPPVLVENFGLEVKKAREKLGLTREELAKKIFEKESLLVRIENTNFEPEEKVVRKLEKVLGVKLLEQ